MGRLQRLRITIASALVVVVAAAALVVLALTAPGYSVQHAQLHDGGIWVTNDSAGLFGRLNKPVGRLDGGFYPPGNATAYKLDVVQDGAAIVGWDQATGSLLPVDVTRAKPRESGKASVPGGSEILLAGDTLAVLDPATGRLWAERVSDTDGVIGLTGVDGTAKPLATVGGHAALAVADDGSVYAASSAAHTLTTFQASSAGLGKPTTAPLDDHLVGALSLTVVGGTPVALDAQGHLAVGGHIQTLPAAAGARLQQASSGGSDVLVETDTALLAVPLGGGTARTLATGGAGTASQPVSLGGCSYAVWSGSGTSARYARACAGAPAAQAVSFTLKDTAPRLVLRLNRGLVAINDSTAGTLWNADQLPTQVVDDWSSVTPPQQAKDDKNKNNNTANNESSSPPKPQDDNLAARPGRAAVLHVLDNDSDPGGALLSIVGVTGLDNPAATVTPSPDGQSVLLSMPQQGSVHFSYTVDDGKASASANVSVTPHDAPADNKPPQLRPGAVPITRTIASGGTATLPVLGDWRDPDSDPVQLVGATTAGGTVSTTPDGSIVYQAPLAAGPQTVTYQVSDGIAAPVSGTVAFTVLSPGATTTSAPVTAPDVARGQVGQPIVLHPLANDLPGVDPLTPSAQLTLAGQVSAPAGATVTTDLAAGTVTVTGQRAGTFLLSYSAAFGNAPFAPGQIRVDVTPASSTPSPLVAMPDTAQIHGQGSDTVDVLANDLDPAGGVLVVQRASVPGTSPQLQVAVVQGHWLRISALTATLTPNPQTLTYTVTNGAQSATGEVSVVQLPAPDKDTPVTEDDYATVRSGDSTTIPVLDNDTNPGGSPITLVQDVTGAPKVGQLTVSSPEASAHDLGTAYVSGNLVRYVAPATVTTPLNVTIDYVAQDPDGDAATGHAHVTVTPPPSPANPDLPPAPKAIEARAVAGDTIVVPIPTTGIDPDGDSTAVVGIAAPTSLGRVLAIGPTSLRYQTYPTGKAGTDSFSYALTDPFGKTATGTVRIAVVPPGDPQPPVAVPDVVTAAPGAHLSVDVMRNDVIALDDTATIQSLAGSNAQVPAGASVDSAGDLVSVTAPPATGKPLVVGYAISDGLATASTSTLTVRSQAGFNQPPSASDAYAQPDPSAAGVDVDLAGSISDADSPGALTISRVLAAGSSISGTVVHLAVLDHPQAVPFEVTDSGGATAMAVVHVPATGKGAPYAKPGASINVDRNGSKSVAVSDYVVDPAHKALQLTTTDTISASPAGGLTVASQGAGQLMLTASNGYAGPAEITFQVTDGATLDDPAGQKAYVTVPVQVGPDTPILRCPTDPLQPVEGGQPITVNVASVCHVWVADEATRSRLTFDASWVNQPAGVSLHGSGSARLVLQAGGSATPGATGSLAITSGGSQPATLPVAVKAAAPPTMTPVLVDGVKAGSTSTTSLVPYVTSELLDKAVTAVSIRQTSGMPSTSSVSGSSITIAPGAGTHGTMTYAVTVSDVRDASRLDRQVTGLVTLHVLGVPDAPGTPAPDHTVRSQVVELSWPVPANNGAPIDSYEVDYNGGSQTCAASPCSITGLHNGSAYTFTVKAHNLVGFGPASAPSAPATPDTVPDAVTGLTAANPQDGSLTLSWNAAADQGSPVTSYLVSWGNGGSQTVSGTSATPSGLNNNSIYTFTVIAVNHQGPGPAASVTGESAGAPDAVGTPAFTSTSTANRSTRAVTIQWTAVDPNGPGPTQYTVNRTGGSGPKTVCSKVTAVSCIDAGLPNDGTKYTYTVTAANQAVGGGNHIAPPSPGVVMEATAQPDDFTKVSLVPTGANGEAKLTFDAPASHGATSTVTCTYHGNANCGAWQPDPRGQAGLTGLITGFKNGDDETITLIDCNGSTGGQQAGSPCGNPATRTVNTYGALPVPVVSASVNSDGRTVAWSVTTSGNGRPATLSIHSTGGANTTETIVGDRSVTGTDTVGWSTTDTITVTLSDSANQRGSTSSQKSVTTPPQPTMDVVAGPYATNTTYCTNKATCRQIIINLHNFQPGQQITLYYDTDCANQTPANYQLCSGNNNSSAMTHYQAEQYIVPESGSFTVNDRLFGYAGAHVWADSSTRGITVQAPETTF